MTFNLLKREGKASKYMFKIDNFFCKGWLLKMMSQIEGWKEGFRRKQVHR